MHSWLPSIGHELIFDERGIEEVLDAQEGDPNEQEEVEDMEESDSVVCFDERLPSRVQDDESMHDSWDTTRETLKKFSMIGREESVLGNWDMSESVLSNRKTARRECVSTFPLCPWSEIRMKTIRRGTFPFAKNT
jgi:hypothetical protein